MAKLKNKIGFLLYPVRELNGYHKIPKQGNIFIPYEDFEFIKSIFQSVYPFLNPLNQQLEENFESCGYNYFDNQTCELIIEKLINLRFQNSKNTFLIDEIYNWLLGNISNSIGVLIYGNL